jgi:hypothetical protein
MLLPLWLSFAFFSRCWYGFIKEIIITWTGRICTLITLPTRVLRAEETFGAIKRLTTATYIISTIDFSAVFICKKYAPERLLAR